FIGSGYGGTKIQLSLEDIREIDAAKPPANEQIDIERHIDERLVKFSKLIGRAEDQIHLLHERRTALISAAVTGKIDVRDWTAPAPQTNKEDAA
ncbi:MAG: restriction endonuclease subunit S, partial [gamma proteobacterium symbiont of Ctena orbiculata]